MSWTHLDDRNVCGRKPYKCSWCGCGIEIKEVHRKCTGVMEGDFQSNRFHVECWAASQEYFRSGEEAFEPGSFKRGTTEER